MSESKLMEKMASPQGSFTLQGGTLGIVLAIGGMVYSNFDDLEDGIRSQETAQVETNKQVAVLAGKLDVLTEAIGSVQKLRTEFEQHKAQSDERILQLEQRITELEELATSRRRR